MYNPIYRIHSVSDCRNLDIATRGQLYELSDDCLNSDVESPDIYDQIYKHSHLMTLCNSIFISYTDWI